MCLFLSVGVKRAELCGSRFDGFFQERTGGQLSYTEACGVLVTSTYLFTLDGICLGENLAHRTILHENEA